MSNNRDSEYIENPELIAPHGLAAVVAQENIYTKLAADLVVAIINARAAVASIPDGGTCNLDSVVVKVPRLSKSYETACKARGIEIDRWVSRPSTYNVIGGAGVGQGQRATKFCELVAAELKAKGHNARVIYYAD